MSTRFRYPERAPVVMAQESADIQAENFLLMNPGENPWDNRKAERLDNHAKLLADVNRAKNQDRSAKEAWQLFAIQHGAVCDPIACKWNYCKCRARDPVNFNNEKLQLFLKEVATKELPRSLQQAAVAGPVRSGEPKVDKEASGSGVELQNHDRLNEQVGTLPDQIGRDTYPLLDQRGAEGCDASCYFAGVNGCAEHDQRTLLEELRPSELKRHLQNQRALIPMDILEKNELVSLLLATGFKLTPASASVKPTATVTPSSAMEAPEEDAVTKPSNMMWPEAKGQQSWPAQAWVCRAVTASPSGWMNFLQLEIGDTVTVQSDEDNWLWASTKYGTSG